MKSACHANGAACCGVVVALIAVGVGQFSAITAAEPQSSTVTLDIQLATANTLPEGARPSLLWQTESIWRHAGVELRWQTTPGQPAPPGALLVIVLERDTAIPRAHSWPVGELVPDGSGGFVVFASIAGARRVIDAAGVGHEPQRLRENRLGLVLGRTIAHEIGHYLLRTNQHSTGGLMRRQISSGDFADLRESQFFLDSTATNWIRRVYAREAVATDRLASFDYEQ